MQQLPELLTALTEELVQIRDRVYAAGAFDGTRLERTEDDDFIYLEAELACEVGRRKSTSRSTRPELSFASSGA